MDMIKNCLENCDQIGKSLIPNAFVRKKIKKSRKQEKDKKKEEEKKTYRISDKDGYSHILNVFEFDPTAYTFPFG